MSICSNPPSVKPQASLHALPVQHSPGELPDDVMLLKQLGPRLSAELDGRSIHAKRILDIMFPDAILPFTVDREVLFSLNDVYSKEHRNWVNLYQHTEDSLASFLNSIAANLDKMLPVNLKSKRTWSSSYSSKALPGSSISRGGDLILLDKPEPQPHLMHWRHIHSIGEITEDSYHRSGVDDTINEKSYVILNTQHNRNFVPMLSFFGNKFRFTVTDREGQLYSDAYSMDEDGCEDALSLLRIIVGLMYTDLPILGYDNSMITDVEGNLTQIVFKDITFDVVELIHAAQCLVGRATQVWRVKHDKHIYVLKDSWALKDLPSEAYFLDKLPHIQGVPTVHIATDVLLDPAEPSRGNLTTGSLRRYMGAREYGSEADERVRRRLVMTEDGAHISSFENMAELVGAMRDVAITLGECASRSIIHRDISYHNILLYKSPDSLDSLRRGLLVDFDCALKLEEADSPAIPSVAALSRVGNHAGTPAFMSVNLLLQDAALVTHLPQHDLESLFYVFIYICTNLTGPRNQIRTNTQVPGSLPMRDWFNHQASCCAIGRTKLGQLASFKQSVIDKFSPYFESVKPFVWQLHKALFPGFTARTVQQPQATHKQFIDIFSEMHRVISKQPEPSMYIAPTKHSRAASLDRVESNRKRSKK